MTRCVQPGCTGEIAGTGFCDECGKPAPVARGTMPAEPETVSTQPVSTARSRAASDLGSFDLPDFYFPDPAARVDKAPTISAQHRRCARCRTELGRNWAGELPRSIGFCTRCGHRYSFVPSLDEGELVADQYTVVGCFARGGLGWVYLAKDRHLDDNLVVLKGLIDVADTAVAVTERRALTMMDHPNIVRIFNFVAHADRKTGENRHYIVMEYVEGLTLGEIKQRTADGLEPLDEPLRVEHVIACGLQILAAFEYLHGRGLLYCDMKPQNVILRPGQHHEPSKRIKVIDLGAVRKAGDRTSKIIETKPFQVSSQEITERGLTVQSDIYTLGITLRHLFQVTEDWRDRKLRKRTQLAQGLESFDLALARATHADADRRFGSAAVMTQQLQGVLREIASLRDGTDRPGMSPVFAPTAALLDDGLGTVPPLDHWMRDWHPKPVSVELHHGRPDPATAASRLPLLRVLPTDSAADTVLSVAHEMDPQVLLGKLSDGVPDLIEVQLARCRAYLALSDHDAAAKCVRRAVELGRAPFDSEWRVRWHDGLVALARANVELAERGFRAVYEALPGEAAPKLALGYCAEVRADLDRAEGLYQAVWRRNRQDVSAAFGLSRIRLARGDRADAVAVLDTVPTISRHADAAGIATVLILSGRLGEDHPDTDDLREAARRCEGLYLDDGVKQGAARTRLTTVIQEAAFDWVSDGGSAFPSGNPRVFGDRADEHELRQLLERSYRELARQARNAQAHGVLLDRANSIRPVTVL